MGHTLLRRRSPEPNQSPKGAGNSTPTKKSISLAIPSMIFVLILLSIYCSVHLLPESFYYCISSQRLNLFCITGGTKLSMVHALNTDNQDIIKKRGVDEDKLEIENAIKSVQENMQVLRSWAVKSSHNTNQRSCDGRGIFIYDLDPKFNKDILDQCHDSIPWADLCEYFTNDGMGLPIPELGEGWYRTHQYSLEPIFHERILNHHCRVYNPEQAQLFYVPFYGGLDVLRWHFKNVSEEVKDALSLELVRWLETQRPWVRNSGMDHMFVLGKISWDFRRNKRHWGNRFLQLEQMRNPYKLLIERHPWEIKEIGIPHPTYFHPHNDNDIMAWQRKIITLRRRNLVSFVGAARPGASENIRSLLINQCNSSDGYCKFLDCNSGKCSQPQAVITMFTESEFCLQPPGDSPTRKSVFDSLVSGCIPVLFNPFTAYYQYPWHLPEDHQRYSVFIDEVEVREGKVSVIERLQKVSPKERVEIRRYIVYELMPGLVYGDSSSKFEKFHDAFGIVMDNLIDRVVGSKQLT